MKKKGVMDDFCGPREEAFDRGPERLCGGLRGLRVLMNGL